MFELASKNKLRFYYKGTWVTEDLWSFSMVDLKNMANILNKECKTIKDDDLFATKTEEDKDTNLRFTIVMHVISTKQEEADEATNAKSIKVQKQRLLELKYKKQNAEMEELTIAELDARIAELG